MINIILLLVLVLGLGLLLYPTVSDYWNEKSQSKAIASYEKSLNTLDRQKIAELWLAAEDYNRKLDQQNNIHKLTDLELTTYRSLLDVTGTGIMSYLQIPKIAVNLPIYHGTSETILQVGIGHLEWSSLPVGGLGTHAVISGHRGLRSAKLLTDLDQLLLGDIFMIKVLNQTLTYKVDQIKTVLPDQMEDLKIVDNQDLITLFTCTPYGINSHRLLVRGHRVSNEEVKLGLQANAEQVKADYLVPIYTLIILVVYIIGRFLLRLIKEIVKTGSGGDQRKSLKGEKLAVKKPQARIG